MKIRTPSLDSRTQIKDPKFHAFVKIHSVIFLLYINYCGILVFVKLTEGGTTLKTSPPSCLNYGPPNLMSSSSSKWFSLMLVVCETQGKEACNISEMGCEIPKLYMLQPPNFQSVNWPRTRRRTILKSNVECLLTVGFGSYLTEKF